jgi:hypothetical protein
MPAESIKRVIALAVMSNVLMAGLRIAQTREKGPWWVTTNAAERVNCQPNRRS